MSSFIVTPTNVDYLESLFKDPITNQWYIPIYTFNTNYVNPFYADADPLNDDPKYQSKVIDHFWIKLTEKWLYRDREFKSLLKYFKITIDGDRGTVSLVENSSKDVPSNIDNDSKLHIFKYIEKFFITRNFVEKVLRNYVKKSGAKWYDLFNNSDTVKKLIKHKLKKLILDTIYELQERRANKKAIDI